MAWITPLHNTCYDEHAMSEVLHEGYTLFKDHRLANLVTAEHRSLLDVHTQDQTGKSNSRKKPLNSLWTMVHAAPEHRGVNCHIHTQER